MKDKKEKDIRDSVKLTTQILEDGNEQIIILEDMEGDLIAKVRLYDDRYNFSNPEKIVIANVLTSEIAEIIWNKKENKKVMSLGWEEKVETLKEALEIDDLKTKETVSWLIHSILNVPRLEAMRRYNVIEDLKSLIPEDVSSKTIEDVYFSKSHLKNNQ